jgi:hypothetical protein
MTKVADLEKIVSNLPPEQLAEFRLWFEALAARLDKEMARKAKGGKPGGLAAEALAGFQKGRVRGL